MIPNKIRFKVMNLVVMIYSTPAALLFEFMEDKSLPIASSYDG